MADVQLRPPDISVSHEVHDDESGHSNNDDDNIEFDVAEDSSEDDSNDKIAIGKATWTEGEKQKQKECAMDNHVSETISPTDTGKFDDKETKEYVANMSKPGATGKEDMYNDVEEDEEEQEKEPDTEYLPYKHMKHSLQIRYPSAAEMILPANLSTTHAARKSPVRAAAEKTASAARDRQESAVATTAALSAAGGGGSSASDKSGNWIWSEAQFKELVLKFNAYVRGMTTVEILKIGRNFWIEAAAAIGCLPSQAKGKWTNTKANFVWNDADDAALTQCVHHALSKRTPASAVASFLATSLTATNFADIGDRMMPIPLFATMCKQRWAHLDSSKSKDAGARIHEMRTTSKMSSTPPTSATSSSNNNDAVGALESGIHCAQQKRKRGRPKRKAFNAASVTSDLRLQTSPHRGRKHNTRLSTPDGRSDCDSPETESNQVRTPKAAKRPCLSHLLALSVAHPSSSTLHTSCIEAAASFPSDAATQTRVLDDVPDMLASTTNAPVHALHHNMSGDVGGSNVSMKSKPENKSTSACDATATSDPLCAAFTAAAAATGAAPALIAEQYEQSSIAGAAAAALASFHSHTMESRNFCGGSSRIRLNREFNGDYYTFADVDAPAGPLVRIEKSPKRAVHLIQMYVCEIERAMDEYSKPFAEICQNASHLLNRISQWNIDKLDPQLSQERSCTEVSTSDARNTSEFQNNTFYIRMFHNTFLKILSACPEVSLEHPSLLQYKALFEKLASAGIQS
jgi:hypothetical protein